MLAMEGLLQHYDRWRGSVVFIQIGVPTRSKVHLYQKLSRTVRRSTHAAVPPCAWRLAASRVIGACRAHASR